MAPTLGHAGVMLAAVLLLLVAVGASLAAVRVDAVAPLIATYALLILAVGLFARADS